MDESQRGPLDEAAVRQGLAGQPFYVDVRVTAATGSTNADLGELARDGAPEGTVVATDHQRQGRGRLTRSWVSPPRAGLAVSVLLRPAVARERWTWLPLLAGLAVVQTVDRTGVGATLKWPNDVLVDGAKLAGVLVEVAGGDPAGAVVGIGLNVTSAVDELPPGATSLTLTGASATSVADRTRVLVDLLDELATAYSAWSAVDGDPTELRDAYVGRCATIGRPVRAELPGGRTLEGVAETVDELGRLVLATKTGAVRLGAGEIVHLR